MVERYPGGSSRKRSASHNVAAQTSPRPAASRWAIAPLRSARPRAWSSAAADPSRAAVGASVSSSSYRQARVARRHRSAGRPSRPRRRGGTPTSGSPRSATSRAVLPLAGVMALAEPRDQRLDHRRDSDRVSDGALGVRDAKLERPVTRVRPQLPPPSAAVAKFLEVAPQARILDRCSQLRTPAARPDAATARRARPDGGEAGVATLVVRGVGGERGKQRQVGTCGVIDGERTICAARRRRAPASHRQAGGGRPARTRRACGRSARSR